MSWLEAWPALGTFNSSISFSCFSGELLADASQRLPVRTARPWASPRLAAVTRLPSHCQDNLQPGTGAVGTGTFTALLRLKTPQGPADAALEPSGVRLLPLLGLACSGLSCFCSSLLCGVSKRRKNVEKSVLQVLLRLWGSPLVGCMGRGQAFTGH